MTRVACAGLVAATSILAAACTHTVVAPHPPGDPAPVFLLDHGRHASLVLERHDGLVRYAYGDWHYYAMNRTGPLRASGTLFGSNRAGLGRGAVGADADLDSVRQRVAVPVEAGWRIEVERDRATALARRLDRFFRRRSASRTYNALYDLEFVPHPDPYNAGHNSNHVTGEWLRALGCRVRLRGPFSAWQVEQPTASDAGPASERGAPRHEAGRRASTAARFHEQAVQ